MPNKKINALDVKVAVSTDLMLVGDPSTGTAYKSTLATLPLVPTSRTITINGVAFDLSANRTWTIDALPSQTGNSGKYLTTNGTAASWGTIDLSGFVPTSRTLTINGTTYDLSADRSWTISSANIYNADGTLTGNRTLTSNTKSLTILGGASNIYDANEETGLILKTTGITKTNVLAFDNVGSSKLFEIRSLPSGQFDMVERIAGLTILKYLSSASGYDIELRKTKVVGNLQSTGSFYVGTNDPGTANGFEIENSSGTTYLTSLNRTSGTVWRPLIIRGSQIDFTTNGSNTSRITSAGRLLLGTTTESTFQLDVNGTARVSGNASFGTTSQTGINYPFLGKIRFCSTSNPYFGGLTSYDFEVWTTAYFESSIILKNGGGIGTTGVTTRMYFIGNNAYFRLNNGSFDIFNVNEAGILVSLENQGTPNASSILEVKSTTRGFLPPRMTTTQINAITTPAEGLQVYNTTINHMCIYQAGAWAKLSHSPM